MTTEFQFIRHLCKKFCIVSSVLLAQVVSAGPAQWFAREHGIYAFGDTPEAAAQATIAGGYAALGPRWFFSSAGSCRRVSVFYYECEYFYSEHAGSWGYEPGSSAGFWPYSAHCAAGSLKDNGGVAWCGLICPTGYEERNGTCIAPTPPPPLGCATGAGGFVSCPGDSGVPPSSGNSPPPLPAGTPVDGGPNPNGGSPGDASPVADGPGGSWGSGATCRATPSPIEAVGNPIFAATGNKYQREVDFASPAGLDVVRHYNSSLPGWTHNWGMRVLANNSQARVIRPDGSAYDYTGTGLGVKVQ